MSTQLERLAKPFPDRLIHSNPSGGGSYVKHSVVTEKLLAVLGPFSFELVEVIRGHVAGTAPNPEGKSARAKHGVTALDDAVVGAVCRLSVSVDEVPVRVEEVGDCEQPHNWPHDGARLKDAMSDSLKRCAMRLGVTLHLWSGPEFSLYDQLRASRSAEAGSEPVGRASGPEPVSAHRSTDAVDKTSDSSTDRTGARLIEPPVAGPTASVPVPVPPTPAVTDVGVGALPPARDVPAPATSDDEWAISPNQLQNARVRIRDLQARGVKFAVERARRGGLPPMDENVPEHDFHAWQLMLDALDAETPAKASA